MSAPSLGVERLPDPLPAGAGAPLFVAVRIGLAMGRARLTHRRALLAAMLGLSLAVVAAIVERRITTAGAVDRALRTVFELVVPLVTFALVVEVTRRDRLRSAVWPAARHGADARAVAFGLVVAASLASALSSAIAAALAVAVAHAPGALPLASDALRSAFVAALAGSAYAGWFALGATFLNRGGGRFVPLAIDFALGGAAGIAAAVLPRGHALHLAGGAAPLGLPRLASTAILAASAALLALWAGARCKE